jgi:hypothetical protein
MGTPKSCLPVILALLAAGGLHASEIGPEDDLEAAIAALEPGGELVLRGGTYRLDRGFRIRVNGTQAQPIVIRAREGERPLLHQTNPRHNVLEIDGSRHLVIRGLAFTGGSHGVRLMASNDVTIEHCEIYETGDVALSANVGTQRGLRLIRNHIHHTNGSGEGMYLGCHDDSCRVAESLIEGNYIHHTNRASVTQGDGIEVKEGGYGNVIRHNVIHDTRYPGIITYGTVGRGPPNVIEGNVVWNSGDYGIQVAADAVIRNNIVIGAPVAFRPHVSARPSNIEFVHNTVIAVGNAVTVRRASGPVIIANNAIYSASGLGIRVAGGNRRLVTLAGNVGTGGVAGRSGGWRTGQGIETDFVDGHHRGGPPIDLFPAPGSALLQAGDPEYLIRYDFDQRPRGTRTDAGAYSAGSGQRPAWTLAPGFKPYGPQ